MGSWLFGNNASANNPSPAATTLRIPTSVQGRAIPLVYGTARIAGNLLWYGDFTSAQVVVGSVGSNNWIAHAFSKAQPIYETRYSASFLYAVAEGPISSIPLIYNNSTTLANIYTTLSGTYSQSAWSFLTSSHPTEALTYRGIGAVGGANASLGQQADLPLFNFLVSSNFIGYGPSGTDANPADVIVDLLTNSYYGVGFPTSLLDTTLTQYRTYTQANDLVVSWAITEQEDAASLISDLLRATNSSARWSSGILTIIPWGDAAITANGATYTPVTTPVYALTDNDFLKNQSGAVSDDPISVKRKRRSDMLNAVKVEYFDSTNKFNPAVVESKDEASITTYGLRASDNRALHMFSRSAPALLSAGLQLGREQIPAIYSFTLPPQYILLDVEDIVTLTHAPIGLSAQAVRITEITENSDYSLSFLAEEYLGTASSPLYSSQANTGFSFDGNADPGNVTDVLIFRPPDLLASPPTGTIPVWVSVTGGNIGIYGGSNVYYSTDNVTFNLVGTTGKVTMGYLTAALPSHADPDAVNTLSVDLTESNGALAQGNAVDVVNAIPPCWVDTEIVAYQTETLYGPNAYNLTTLKRGAYGSTINAHAIETGFALLDSFVFHMTVPSGMSGLTVYFKFQAFNTVNGGIHDLSTLTVYPYVIGGTYEISPRSIPQQQSDMLNEFEDGTAAATMGIGTLVEPIPDADR